MEEKQTIKAITFPIIPDDVSDEMRDYLMQLERVIESSLIGSLYLEGVLRGGILGN